MIDGKILGQNQTNEIIYDFNEIKEKTSLEDYSYLQSILEKCIYSNPSQKIGIYYNDLDIIYWYGKNDETFFPEPGSSERISYYFYANHNKYGKLDFYVDTSTIYMKPKIKITAYIRYNNVIPVQYLYSDYTFIEEISEDYYLCTNDEIDALSSDETYHFITASNSNYNLILSTNFIRNENYKSCFALSDPNRIVYGTWVSARPYGANYQTITLADNAIYT